MSVEHPKTVVVLGSKAAGLATLETVSTVAPKTLAAVVTPDDRGDGRSCFDEISTVARELDLPLTDTDASPDVEAALDRHKPDLVIVCGWYRRLLVERRASTQFLGFHASPLPRYRGGSPLPWQIINGEEKIGLSFFRLEAGLDTGPTLEISWRPLAENETIADALGWVEGECARMVARHLPSLLDGTAQLTPQGDASASYCAQRLPEDGQIDWRWSARRVHDFVRAQTAPYPGAFSVLPDLRSVRVWETAVFSGEYAGVPGAVVARSGNDAIVACGEGAVLVKSAQIEDGPRQRGTEALGSLRLRFHQAPV